MDEPTQHLRTLARRVVAATLERVPLRAALLAGSGGRGDADLYSDLDLLLYVDELPPEDVPGAVRAAVGGTDPIPREPTEHVCGEEFRLGGVRTEMSFVTVAHTEWLLDQLLVRFEEIGSPLAKVALGIAEGLPLHGAELIRAWQRSLDDYPDGLRRAMVERYWNFFPLWYYRDALTARDAELWRLDMLLEAAFNLLGVLAGVNGLYFTRFQLKHVRRLAAGMRLAPSRLVDRLESLFRIPPDAAAEELERLVAETRELVRRELPDLELPLRFPVGARQRPWRA